MIRMHLASSYHPERHCQDHQQRQGQPSDIHERISGLEGQRAGVAAVFMSM